MAAKTNVTIDERAHVTKTAGWQPRASMCKHTYVSEKKTNPTCIGMHLATIIARDITKTAKKQNR